MKSFKVKKYSGTFYNTGLLRSLDLKTVLIPETDETVYKTALFNKSIAESYVKGYSGLAEGMIEGAGLKKKDFTAYFYGPRIASPRGCSTFGLTGKRSKDGSPVIGRNYDWFYSARQWCEGRVFNYRDFGELKQFTHHWAGSADCMNAEGLFISLSAFRMKVCSDPGLNWHFIIDLVSLLCDNVKDAVRLIRELPHYRSYVYLLADKDNIAVVEVTPGQTAVRYPQEDYIIVTNHPVKAELFYSVENPVHYLREESSNRRYNTIRCAVKNIKSAGEDSVKDVLSLHRGNVCRGPHVNSAEPGFGTIYSLILKPAENLFLAAPGHACVTDFHSIKT